jgi:hypothetical protein
MVEVQSFNPVFWLTFRDREDESNRETYTLFSRINFTNFLPLSVQPSA